MLVVSGGVAVITAPDDGFATHTAANLIDAVAQIMGRWAKETATGGTTTTLVDTKRYESTSYWDEHFIKGLSGANDGLQQVVTNWSLPSTTATLVPARGTWGNNDIYRLTSFNQERMFSSGMVRGILDQAIDASYDYLFYEIANDDLALIQGVYEYSFRTVNSVDSWIKDLRQVQYRLSSTDAWSDLRFRPVGNGTHFELIDWPGTSVSIRLIGTGYTLRTDSSGTVIPALIAETDRVTVERGKERIIIARALEIMANQVVPPKSVLGKEDIARMIAQAERDFGMKRQSIPFVLGY